MLSSGHLSEPPMLFECSTISMGTRCLSHPVTPPPPPHPLYLVHLLPPAFLVWASLTGPKIFPVSWGGRRSCPAWVGCRSSSVGLRKTECDGKKGESERVAEVQYCGLKWLMAYGKSCCLSPPLSAGPDLFSALALELHLWTERSCKDRQMPRPCGLPGVQWQFFGVLPTFDTSSYNPYNQKSDKFSSCSNFVKYKKSAAWPCKTHTCWQQHFFFYYFFHLWQQANFTQQIDSSDPTESILSAIFFSK